MVHVRARVCSLYPFIEDCEFQANVDRAIQALASLPRFSIVLRRFSYFQHSAKSATLWLQPTTASNVNDEPSAELIQLQSLLEAAFPFCTEQRTISGSFQPHLSVGQFGSKIDVERHRDLFQSTWEPIEFDVTCVYFISRISGDDPFEVHIKIDRSVIATI